MSKWSYLPPLLSLTYRLLQRDDVADWLRRSGRPVTEGFDFAQDRVGDAVESAVERLLQAMNLQRRPTTVGRLGSSLGWAGAGAALAAGALLATQLDRSQVQEWLNDAGDRVGGMASRSAKRLERLALDEWLELLGRVGLQPQESRSTRALRAAGWVGAGTLAGAGTVALLWAFHRRRIEVRSVEEPSDASSRADGMDGGSRTTEAAGTGARDATEAN